jgi:ribosome-binding ATPase YchF (GTP1/OBG family)
MLLVLIAGCQSESERVVEVAREAAQRQAEQNRQMTQLQNQVAEGSRQLVEAEAKARAELTALQRDLQQGQAEVDRQRDELEAERRKIASERYWDAILGSSITAAVALLACLLPLVLCWALLRRQSEERDADATLAEFLVQELVSGHPALLPASPPCPLLIEATRDSGSPQEPSGRAEPGV